MNKTNIPTITSMADVDPSERRELIEARANETAAKEAALQADLRTIGQDPQTQVVESQEKTGQLSIARKAAFLGAATLAAVGGIKAIDVVTEGNSETDDLKHYVEGGTPEDLNSDPEKQVIEVPGESQPTQEQ